MNSDLTDLLRLYKPHIKSATEVLTRAFWAYPVSTYAYSDEQLRDKRLPYFFQYVLHYCIKYGEVYATSANYEGIGLWLPSDKYPMTIWRTLRSVPFSGVLNLGRESGRRMKAFGDYVDSVHAQQAPFPHWFLQTISVDPDHQGKGYASSLLRPILARIDEEGLPCYLETLDKQDVSIYEHFGFKVVHESIVPKTELTNWAMLRSPLHKT
ncbi:GNAT family N-acetyltransferase [Chloroflexota bacterium]